MDINSAIKNVWAFISRTNKYIDETAPWALAKDPAQKAHLDAVMYNLAESLRIISVLISPFMPNTAPKIWSQLGIEQEFASVQLDDIKKWGNLPAGTKVNKPEQIFPRIEVEEVKAEAPIKVVEKSKAASAAKTENNSVEITIDEFAKMDLRVVKVLAAEKIKKADKLLMLTVDLGNEQRTIVSGIAKYYEPEDLIGKNVVMVINLKPAKIRGVVSHGMVLAASTDEALKVVEVDMPVGSKVK